ncbi:uncharacterized protein PGTG_13449 [Puccinia graminis f. sp. tritici CRL 75-36-700-3]|uniref:MYND-type domain-containing protein n=1 Tax=Puccinia graminis f. sp. tritici (strain CRL 75-36-700-3 / race SCCL) TaxID=418459 RepID=E3KTW0_PUCGT|nr:uncharacterized protein PGTG_13449 [Puccinia graminis f. sp. tritici CRL 75-36-700-3]EFP87663.2 hypothetical protein PGTG_13449 [Puccinia graminis f. sp. tritici CRL 75-36-700-3]
MRESNFYFPAHNKASVSITSALYDRRAIDATSPLPLLSTLTHLSYLTSTSPRIREILCSDGGLERLISILRSTGRRMREQRRNLQQQQQPTELAQPITIPSKPKPTPSSSSSAVAAAATSSSSNNHSQNQNLIRISPFRPFLNSPITQPTSQPTSLTLQPPITNQQTPTPTPFPTQPLAPQPTLSTQPLASHQIATLGLTKEQKQLLWTWSLSFQCVVNIGVRGTESIRTRVVEAGVVPVIISVLGGYLHEMERVRQQSENQERARKKAALEAASTGHSRTLVSSSQRSYSLNADLPRPPRPVLSSRTLVQPIQNPSSQLPISDLPASIITTNNHNPRSTLPLPPSSSSSSLSLNSTLTNPTNQSTATQTSSHPQPPRPESAQPSTNHLDINLLTSARPATRNPISISSTTDPVLRTGSISPSSVSSSSSLETSRLHLNQQAILRNDGSTSSSTLDHPVDLIDVDSHENQSDETVDRASPDQTHTAGVSVEMDDQSAADESEADVVMELVGDDEAGPSNGRQRSRRGTIKASQANAHKVVHITPLAPPRPTLTELDHENLPLNTQSQSSPMEGLETDANESENNPELGNSSAIIHAVNHQTPRASSARLPHSGPGRSQAQTQHPSSPSSSSAIGSAVDPVSEDVPMTASSETATLTSNSASETDYSPPLDPALGAPQENTAVDPGQLSRVLSETEGAAPTRAFTTRRQPAPPEAAPAPTANVADPVAPNAPAARAAPPSVGSTSLSSPVTLAFRDEDVLLALQLLAYLSKYAHVRAYFHEPANRSTLELTYGSMQDATRALAKFSGRFKSERYERERGKEFSSGTGIQGSSRRPASAQDQHSLPDADPVSSSTDLRGTSSQAHYPHRSYSSSMMRARMQVEEALEEARLGRGTHDPSLTNANRAPSSDPGTDPLRPALLLGGVTLFSTSPMVNTVPQMLRQPSFVLGQSGSNLMPGVAPSHGSHHQYYASHSGSNAHDLDPARMMYNHARAQLSNPVGSSTGSPSSSSSPSTINPLASNVFSYVERFTHQRLPHDVHSPTIPGEIQYWAGVIMRNACRKDETRGGIRQCANMQCGRWESVPREFAKCRRCRKAKYCSKSCQSRAWQHGHRFWCSTRAEGESSSTAAPTNMGTGETEAGAASVGTAAEGGEGAVEDPSRRVDRASRALVDAAIERLRRTGDGPAGAGRRDRGDISEAASNIATPPDRELRVENTLNHVAVDNPNTLPHHPHPHHHHPHHPHHHHHHHPEIIIAANRNLQTQNNPDLVVVPADQLVDERDQIRLMVQNPQDDQIINP